MGRALQSHQSRNAQEPGPRRAEVISVFFPQVTASSWWVDRRREEKVSFSWQPGLDPLTLL